MKTKFSRLSREYQAALQEYVSQKPGAGPGTARGFGSRALAAGLHTLDLAKIHERALISMGLDGSGDGVLKRSQVFFAEAITPLEETHRAALEARIHLRQLNETLSRRTVELAATNLELKKEITQRRAIEKSLRESKRHYGTLLKQARELQEQLRFLSHQILSAQEEERKKISRELHDVIAQTLTGINVQLAKLKTEAALNAGSLERNISSTQRLVEKSVTMVHRFARELRPTVLDDLGLIPALHTFMKSFREQTGLRVSLTAVADVENLNGAKRTVLYRVAQEALNNVARHARASQVDVTIQKTTTHVILGVKDDGKGFETERVLQAKRNRRLGVLGMRERVEMVSGELTIKSTPGKGTAIQAHVPFGNTAKVKPPGPDRDAALI